MFASFDRCSNCAGSKEGSNESFDSGAFSSGPTLASPWQWPRDGRAMDVRWTCNGRAMDVRWTRDGRAMDAPWTQVMLCPGQRRSVRCERASGRSRRRRSKYCHIARGGSRRKCAECSPLRNGAEFGTKLVPTLSVMACPCRLAFAYHRRCNARADAHRYTARGRGVPHARSCRSLVDRHDSCRARPAGARDRGACHAAVSVSRGAASR